jgi:hypothetical protein
MAFVRRSRWSGPLRPHRWWALGLLGGLICATASASATGDVRLVAASAGGYGTAQGVEVSDAQLESGSPPDRVDSTSVSDYDVSLTFSFTIAPSGLITGAGQGEYTAVHVHVAGRRSQREEGCLRL